MRTFALAMVVAVGLVALTSAPVLACGGHESRAADCLERLFGSDGSHVSGMSDHALTVTVDGQSQTAHGTEQNMIDQLSDFLLSHGITQTSTDPCDRTSNAQNIFESNNLAG
ncbi:MAG: hypothetical protein HYZ53_04030 [Planctomycetes bacterium]|nr:hypothetical protein [Planctomycetota bacterium]